MSVLTGSRRRTLGRVGLVLAALLAVGDVLTSIPQYVDEPVIPTVAIVLAVATLVAVPFAWRDAAWARGVVIATRLLSALLAVPAFFFPGVPPGWVVAAATGILLSVLVVVLLLVGARAPR